MPKAKSTKKASAAAPVSVPVSTKGAPKLKTVISRKSKGEKIRVTYAFNDAGGVTFLMGPKKAPVAIVLSREEALREALAAVGIKQA